MSFTWAVQNDDVFIGSDGKLAVLYGAQEVKQRVLITLKHYYQEYFLNVPGGTPWFELILGNKNAAEVSALLRQIILSVSGVISIVDFRLGFMNRVVTITTIIEVEGITGPEAVDIYYSNGGV